MTKAIIPFLPHQWYSLYFHTLHKKNKALQSCKQVGKKNPYRQSHYSPNGPSETPLLRPLTFSSYPTTGKSLSSGRTCNNLGTTEMPDLCLLQQICSCLAAWQGKEATLSLRNSSCIIRTRNCIKNRQKNSLFIGLEGPILNTTLSRICIMFRTRIWLHITAVHYPRSCSCLMLC